MNGKSLHCFVTISPITPFTIYNLQLFLLSADSALDDESVESDGSAIEVPETPVDSFIVDYDDDSSDDDDNEEVSTRKGTPNHSKINSS